MQYHVFTAIDRLAKLVAGCVHILLGAAMLPLIPPDAPFFQFEMDTHHADLVAFAYVFLIMNFINYWVMMTPIRRFIHRGSAMVRVRTHQTITKLKTELDKKTGPQIR